MHMIPLYITLSTTNYYLVRIGAEPDIASSDAPNYKKTRVFCMISDPRSGRTEREEYKQFIDPFIEKLPEDKQDLNYFLLYYEGNKWVHLDVTTVPEPRTWASLREASGLEDL